MLLSRLVLKNFKRYRNQEICFRDGITGIVGNNGTGKSTIVEAILFALYGVQGTALDPEYIVSSFAGPRERCEVRLDFSVAGSNYIVKRTFRKTASSTQHEAQLFMDGGEKQLAETVTDVAREVRRIIGMGSADFRNTIYAGQKDLLSLLDRRPGERREWFMKILGIDYLKKESLGELKRLLDANDGELKRTTGKWEEIDTPALERRMVDQGEELKARGRERQKREEECTAARDRVRDLAGMLEALHADEKDWIRLTEHQRALDNEIQRAEKECLRLDGEIESRRVLLSEFEGLESQEKHYLSIKDQYQVLVGKKRQLEQIEAEKHYLALQQRQCAERIAQSDEMLRHLEHDRETCRRLEPEIARRDAVKKELNRQKPQEKTYNELCGSLDRLRERFRGIEQRLHDIGGEIRRLEEKSRDLEGSDLIVAGYEAVCEQEKAFAEAQMHAQRCEGWREKIRDEEGRLIQLKERIEFLTHTVSGMETISSQITEAEEQCDRFSGTISSAESRLGSLVEEFQALDTHIDELVGVGSESPCPTCHRPLHDHFDILMDELHASRSAAEQAVSDQKHLIDALRTEKAGSYDHLKRLNQERESLRRRAEERAILQSEFRTRTGQLESWQKEIDREEEAVRSLGISGYDPDHHQAVIQKRKVLEEIAKRIDGLAIECSRLPALQEEWHRISAEGDRCILGEEAIIAEIRRLGHDPAQKLALEEELSSSDHLLQEYERAQQRCESRPKVEEERASFLSMQEHLAAETERLKTATENLAYRPDLFSSAEEEWNRADENHHGFMELRVKMEQLPELIESRSRTEAHIEGIRLDREENGRRIAALGFSRSRILEVEEERRTADERARIAETELNRCSSTILLLQAEMARYAADLERAEQYRKQLDALREEREMLNLTQTMIGRYIVHLLTVVRGQIEGMVGDILGEITDGRYDRILLDEDFTILVNDMGGDYPADRFSGGEQDDIAIALRIALSRYLAGIHQIHDSTFLIFDEIFGSQDEERRNNLIRALRTQEIHFPQILLISHIGEVQEEFSTTLSVELGPDQASRVEERCA